MEGSHRVSRFVIRGRSRPAARSGGTTTSQLRTISAFTQCLSCCPHSTFCCTIFRHLCNILLTWQSKKSFEWNCHWNSHVWTRDNVFVSESVFHFFLAMFFFFDVVHAHIILTRVKLCNKPSELCYIYVKNRWLQITATLYRRIIQSSYIFTHTCSYSKRSFF